MENRLLNQSDPILELMEKNNRRQKEEAEKERLGDADRSIDGDKKVKGRKQHVVTDSLGLVIPANVHDSKGAMLVLDGLRGAFRRLTRIIANGGRGGRGASPTG